VAEIERRHFLAVAGALLAAPLARAQQGGRVYRIGLLSALSRTNSRPFIEEFLQGMRERGWVEGVDYSIVARYAEGKNERLPGLATELVDSKVDLIFASTVQVVAAAQQVAGGIPIVFVAVSDPVKQGFADSVARPGRNLTGMSNFAGDLAPKRLELLKTLLPRLSRVAFLVNPGNPNTAGLTKLTQAGAAGLDIEVKPVNAATLDDIEGAFAAMARERLAAVLVMGDVYFFGARAQIAAAALKHRIALISPFREYAESGGLMSYGTDAVYQFRHVATYVDRILKGANPGDLPIEQPAKFELVINLKTAKSLGITIPQSLLLRADRVIE
jgi:putative ABC transport system substrate-binding protein